MVETFDLNPALPLPEQTRLRGEQSDSKDGPVHRSALWNKFLDVWELHLTHLSDAHVKRLRDLWELTKGGTRRMLWRPPGTVRDEYVRFTADGLKITQESGAFSSAKVRLELLKVT
jgi:phage-related protein